MRDRTRRRKRDKGLTLVWFAIGTAVTLWLAYRYSGVYRLLSEWQLQRFGFYLPGSTLALIAAVIAIPVLVIVLARHRDDDAHAQSSSRLSVALSYRRVSRIAVGVFGALALASLGAILLLPRESGGEQIVAVAAPLMLKSAREGRATMAGGVLEQRAVLYRQRFLIGERETAFAMIQSATGGSPLPGRVFVQLQPWKDGYALPRRTGLLVRGGLPGPIRALYGQLGVPVVAEHLVLYADAAPLRLAYFQAAAQAAVIALIFVLLLLVQERRIKRARQPEVSVALA